MRTGIITLDYLYEFKEKDYPNLVADFEYGKNRLFNIIDLHLKHNHEVISFDQVNDYHKNELIFDLMGQFRNRFREVPQLTDDSGLYTLKGSLIRPIIKGDLSKKEYRLIFHFRTEKLLWLQIINDRIVVSPNIALNDKEKFKLMTFTIRKDLWISSFIDKDVNGHVSELSASHEKILLDKGIINKTDA